MEDIYWDVMRGLTWPLFNYIPAYEEVNDEQVLIDEEGDLVIYGETKRWPSFSYWLVPGTQEDARLWALTH